MQILPAKRQIMQNLYIFAVYYIYYVDSNTIQANK